MCLSFQWPPSHENEVAVLNIFNGDPKALEGSLYTFEGGIGTETGSHISVSLHDGFAYVSLLFRVRPLNWSFT